MCIPWLFSCPSQEFDLKKYFTVNDCSTNSDEGGRGVVLHFSNDTEKRG